MTRVIFLSKYSVIDGDVVYRDTGKKVRGKFEIKQGKIKTSIWKISEKTGKKKFVGFATKMNKKTLKDAIKYKKTRDIRAAKKALKQSGLTKFAKDEYERQMIQKKDTGYESDYEPSLIQREQDDYREKVKKGKDILSRESVRDIGTAKRSTPDLYGMLTKETQNMINFERILTAMENDGTLTIDKINDMKRMLSETGGMDIPNFNNVSDFTNWLFSMYRDAKDRNLRTELWDLLHSLQPEQGYTYDPLSV